MLRNLLIVLAAAVVVALPFLFRRDRARETPGAEALTLVIVSPHNEAIRYEFARAFSDWHQRERGRPVKVEWLSIGGTTEIARYLEAQYIAAVRAWWRRQGRAWLPGAEDALLDPRFPSSPPEAARRAGEDDATLARRWEELRALNTAFRATDDPAAFGARIDLFFGGGQYDHHRAFGRGLTVAPWPPDAEPEGLFRDARGRELIPERVSGEIWRAPTYFGCALSAFGICWNRDRIRALNVPPPAAWEDLARPEFFRQIGAADPTKSGSIAKAFEMIVHQQCRRAVGRAGFDAAQIAVFEARYAATRNLAPGARPEIGRAHV